MNFDRIQLNEELSAFVAQRIAGFESECEDGLRWLVPYVRKHQILPLVLGWIETYGIRADGSIFKFYADGDIADVEYEELRIIGHTGLAIGTLVQGAKRYPPLEAAIPKRPQDAVVCEECNGIGIFASHPEVICGCGGLGWKLPQSA